MKKIILILAVSISILSCKKNNSSALSTYKYADKPQTLACSTIDSKLFTEAYYAFENAILIHGANTNRRPGSVINTDFAFRNFTARAQNNLRIQDYITEETAAVFKVLKTQDIWDGNHLNYNSDIVKCIANSISNTEIKQTFKTLQSVNSLDPKLMAAAIYGNTKARDKFKDKALMTYVALDIFYAKMQNVDMSTVKFITKQDKPAVAPVTKRRPIAKKPIIGQEIKLDTKKAVKHGPNDGHNH